VTEAMRSLWDAEAARFDDEPDHGLGDPIVRRAWTDLLVEILPPAPARVLDLGCGTGTLSVLLAELGYEVTGVDLSPRMVERAEAKALGHQVSARFTVGDASAPAPCERVDVVLARHVVWALPDVPAALDRWVRLLDDDGLLVLIEGFWATGAGWRAAELRPLVESRASSTTVRHLSSTTSLWGAPVTDERYVISGRVQAPREAVDIRST
jgi:SAM-dependent methyltransferase